MAYVSEDRAIRRWFQVTMMWWSGAKSWFLDGFYEMVFSSTKDGPAVEIYFA
jgi:hypothetical protein